MSLVVTIVHIVACFFLIAVVLLQTGKGADIGAVFGGSSQTIFGSSGAGNLLTRLTTWTAAVFMLTSVFLTWDSTRHLTLSIADDAPIEPPPLEAPLVPGGPDQSAPATDSGAAPAAEAGVESKTTSAASPDQAAPVEAASAGDKAPEAAPATAEETAPSSAARDSEPPQTAGEAVPTAP